MKIYPSDLAAEPVGFDYNVFIFTPDLLKVFIDYQIAKSSLLVQLSTDEKLF